LGRQFPGDCAGGLIAALIALPYGLAMASLMGLPPVLGIFTSILTAPIIALLGRTAAHIPVPALSRPKSLRERAAAGVLTINPALAVVAVGCSLYGVHSLYLRWGRVHKV